MAYYIELTENPDTYRAHILRMWQEYLPDTPPQRYEWLTKGNPAGRTKWFLALDQQTGELLGFITLMPRNFFYDGEEMLFGIMGDFVVEKRHRGFGPGIQLPKYVLGRAKELGFKLVYTLPYYDSLKPIERAGFKLKIKLGWLIKPLMFNNYLSNSAAARLLNLCTRVFDMMCSALVLNSVVMGNDYFTVAEVIDDSFDEFWAELKRRERGVLGSRDSRYLEWRYMQNPLVKFKTLALRCKVTKELSGYVVFTKGDNKLNIYDIQCKRNRVKYLLLQKLVQIAREEGCEGIYLLSSVGARDSTTLKVFGFIPHEEEHSLYYAALGSEMNLEAWWFFQGDRNV